MTPEDLFPLYGCLPRITDADLADLGHAIDRRRLDELHPCVFCGEQGRAPLAASASDLVGPAQWLDLCPEHNREVRIMLDELRNLAFDAQELDAEIMRRYEAWAESAGAARPGG